MPFHRNFTYYIDKRQWKFYFLMVAVKGLSLQGLLF
jgi:hypothetical protein